MWRDTNEHELNVTWLNVKLWHPWLPISFSFFLCGIEESAAEVFRYYPLYKSPTQRKTLIYLEKQNRQNEIMLPQADSVLITLDQTSFCLWQQKSSAEHRPHWVARETHTKWPLDPRNALRLSPTAILSEWTKLQKRCLHLSFALFATRRKARVTTTLSLLSSYWAAKDVWERAWV